MPALGVRSPELRCRHGLRRDLSSSALPILPQSVSRGARISGFLIHVLPSCSPANTDQTDASAPEGFYFQAPNGLVALPVFGHIYNGDWTPLLAGLSPTGMAASLATPEPYVRLSRIRLTPRVCASFVERLFEQVDADVVEERGEPFLLPFPRDFPYVFQRL
jgi:hypothetical protein